MRRFGWVALALMSLMVAGAPALAPPAHAKRVALVVGINKYDNLPRERQLVKAVNDARSIEVALKSVGFEVIKAEDVGRSAFNLAWQQFLNKLSPGDEVAMFFSGHGVEIEGGNYLIPRDVPAVGTGEARRLKNESLSFDEMRRDLAAQGPRLSLFILDACRDNPFADTRGRSIGGAKGLVPVQAEQGSFVMFAAGARESALDRLDDRDSDPNSVYTRKLLPLLKEPGLRLPDLAQRVRGEVRQLAGTVGHRQSPAYYDEGADDVCLAGCAKPAATASAPEISEAAREWARVDKTSVAELETFVRRHGSSPEADYARARLDKFKQQAAVSVPPPAPVPDPSAKPAASIIPQVPGPLTSLSRMLKIGVAGPLTGPNGVFGGQLKNGAEQAAADINAKGGINGQKIELVFGDDVSDPKQGVSVANKFVRDGVKFVIGHFNSGVTMPASEVYQENGIYMITPGATNPKITERDMWNVFRTCGRDDRQGEVAGKYILDKFKGKKIAIVHDKTTYGQGLAEETKKTMNKGGMKEVLYEGINIGEKDFSALVSRIKASSADLVYWGGLHTQGGLIVRQMRDQGIKALLMGGDGITTDEFASIGGPGVEGTLMTFGPDVRKNPAAAQVVKTFQAKNINPEAYTLYSYAALQVIAMSAADAKSVDPKMVAEATRSGKAFKTVIGDLSYNQKGDITRPDYVMYTWRKGADGKISYFQN